MAADVRVLFFLLTFFSQFLLLDLFVPFISPVILVLPSFAPEDRCSIPGYPGLQPQP